MLRIIMLITSVPAIQSIIVTDPPPVADYKYSYNVEDPSTGDSKSQHEIRYGDSVSGAYSVVDPDGTKRTVEYSADPKHGFKATIRQEPVKNNIPELSPSQYVTNDRYINYRYEPLLAKQEHISDKPVMESIINHISYSNAKEGYGQQVYFTPENEAPQESFRRGYYFIPAHNK